MRVSVELLRFIGLSGVMKSNSLFALKINLNIHARLCINVYRSLWMDASNLRQPLIHTIRKLFKLKELALIHNLKVHPLHLTCGSCFHPTHFAEQKKIHDKTERGAFTCWTIQRALAKYREINLLRQKGTKLCMKISLRATMSLRNCFLHCCWKNISYVNNVLEWFIRDVS